jgi:hypothetical protein
MIQKNSPFIKSIYILLFTAFLYFVSRFILKDQIPLFPYVVMIVYFTLRIISAKDNFWAIKAVVYFAIGMVTLVNEPKVTSLIITISFIETFDLIFENWGKSKLDGINMLLYGYDLCDLENAYRNQKNVKFF